MGLVPGGVTVRGCKFDNETGRPFFKECQDDTMSYDLPKLLLWATLTASLIIKKYRGNPTSCLPTITNGSMSGYPRLVLASSVFKLVRGFVTIHQLYKKLRV